MFGLVQASNRSFFWPSDAAQRWPLETVRRVPAKGGGRVPAKGGAGTCQRSFWSEMQEHVVFSTIVLGQGALVQGSRPKHLGLRPCTLAQFSSHTGVAHWPKDSCVMYTGVAHCTRVSSTQTVRKYCHFVQK
jgi:hypothetical protein